MTLHLTTATWYCPRGTDEADIRDLEQRLLTCPAWYPEGGAP